MKFYNLPRQAEICSGMESRRKIVYIISDVEKSLAFEWTADHLVSRCDLFFILIGRCDTPLTRHLNDLGVRYDVVSNDAYPSMFRQWWQVFRLLRRERPAMVHIHLWRAMLLGLSASWVLRVPKRIFTRHHAALHHRDYPSGLKLDKLCNRMATDIVAISQNVRDILITWEGVPQKKIHLIHHGFDLSYFRDVSAARERVVRERYGLPEGAGPVIGVIARYTELKGITFIISAFAQILEHYPMATLVLANAQGDYASQIRKVLQQLSVERYREITFEQDLGALYRLFDVFVHVPTDLHGEAFGQTYVEALAAGSASVFTLSGVAAEFIDDGKNALVVPYRDADAIANAILRLLNDNTLRQKLVQAGRISARQFELKNMLDKLDELYG